MAFYAVEGYDDIFGGYHGMIEREVIEADSTDEAYSYAEQLSWSVLESYGEIVENLEETVREECEFNDISYEDDDAVATIRDEVYREDLAYNISILNTNKLPTLDLNKLNQMFYNFPEGFIEEYAVK